MQCSNHNKSREETRDTEGEKHWHAAMENDEHKKQVSLHSFSVARLEQQALVYKYMASGIPVPPDLLFNIRRNYPNSPLSARFLSHLPQHVGWNYLQMGRKIDPEPGRCRRTDGKKWRCSKEAHPDSKYCERHMHRGKNRSRKPVENLKPTPTNTNSSRTKNPSAAVTPLLSSSLASESHHSPQHFCYTNTGAYRHPPSLYHNNSNANANGLSFQDNTTPLFHNIGAAYHHSRADYRNRNMYGREEVSEHTFFSESSGAMRNLCASSGDDSWQCTPLTLGSSSSEQRSCSSFQEYSCPELRRLSDSNTQQDKITRNNSHGLSDDTNCEIPMRLGNDEPEKTTHWFFDEFPHEGRGSWLNLDDKTSNSSSISTTRLSISIPTFHDFPSL